ncbi:MAG: DsrE/DsrF/DrsH-like family protein [Chloroflexota bacterium]
MGKVAITCNGAGPENIFPTLILASAAAACGDDVILFFEPEGAPVLVKGELEKIKAKGMPDLMELYEGFLTLGGRIIVCELAVGAKDIRPEDFREGVEIMGATSFLGEIADAQITFSF